MKHESVFLKGNHETFLLDVLNAPSQLQNWKQYGGLQTLASYGLNPSLNPDPAEQDQLIRQLSQAIPVRQQYFLRSLRARFVDEPRRQFRARLAHDLERDEAT